MGKEKNMKTTIKTKLSRNLKKVHEQDVIYFLILRMYTKFHKNRSINKKVDSDTRWSP